MLAIGEERYWTRAMLADDLAALGLRRGDAVLAHGAMRAVGPMLNGPDALIGALRDVIGAEGTLLVYVDWDGQYEDAIGEDGRLDPVLKVDIPPFDPAASRASRDHGVFAEFARTTPGAYRSANPGASMVALGARAQWFTDDHPLNYGYGEGSPFAKLVEAGGKVAMIGAPLDAMSLLHHAEHLARIPEKRIRRYEVPLIEQGAIVWRQIEEYDTVDPVVDGLDEDYFGTIVTHYLAGGRGKSGTVGHAPGTLVDAAGITAFAVQWLEQRFPLF